MARGLQPLLLLPVHGSERNEENECAPIISGKTLLEKVVFFGFSSNPLQLCMLACMQFKELACRSMSWNSVTWVQWKVYTDVINICIELLKPFHNFMKHWTCNQYDQAKTYMLLYLQIIFAHQIRIWLSAPFSSLDFGLRFGDSLGLELDNLHICFVWTLNRRT